MPIEQEGIEPQEQLPGQFYKSMPELHQEVKAQKSRMLRIFGKKLVEKPSQTRPGLTYFEMEDYPDESKTHFVATIFKSKSPDKKPELVSSYIMNAYDYQKLNKYGGPEQIYSFDLDNRNVGNFRIEVVPEYKVQILVRELMEKGSKGIIKV